MYILPFRALSRLKSLGFANIHSEKVDCTASVDLGGTGTTLHLLRFGPLLSLLLSSVCLRPHYLARFTSLLVCDSHQSSLRLSIRKTRKVKVKRGNFKKPIERRIQ